MNYKEACITLGISEQATKDEAKKAFKKMAAKHHPDVNKEPDAEAKFKKINEAYQVIESGKTDNNNSYYNRGGVNFEDIFGAGFHSPFRQAANIAEDIVLNTTISFKDSVLGCQKILEYKRNIRCDACRGNGVIKLNNGCSNCKGLGAVTTQKGNVIMQMPCHVCGGKQNIDPCNTCSQQGFVENNTTVTVNIPPGVTKERDTLGLRGVGNYHKNFFNSEAYTDVILKVSVDEDPNLRIENDDVVSNLTISLLEALEGTKKSVFTIDGETEIDIPALIKNNNEVILPNLGVNRQGSQKVIINIEYPPNVESIISLLKSKES